MTHDPATCLACGRAMPGNRCEHCGSRSRWVETDPESWREPANPDPTLFTTPVKKGRPSNAEKTRLEAERKAVT